jgi:hypothetical protein
MQSGFEPKGGSRVRKDFVNFRQITWLKWFVHRNTSPSTDINTLLSWVALRAKSQHLRRPRQWASVREDGSAGNLYTRPQLSVVPLRFEVRAAR